MAALLAAEIAADHIPLLATGAAGYLGYRAYRQRDSNLNSNTREMVQRKRVYESRAPYRAPAKRPRFAPKRRYNFPLYKSPKTFNQGLCYAKLNRLQYYETWGGTTSSGNQTIPTVNQSFIVRARHILACDNWQRHYNMYTYMKLISMKVTFIIQEPNKAPLCLTYTQLDDDDAQAALGTFMRQPTLRKHMITADKKNSRTLQLGALSQFNDFMKTDDAQANLAGGTTYDASIKILFPNIPDGVVIQLLEEHTVAFRGVRDMVAGSSNTAAVIDQVVVS